MPHHGVVKADSLTTKLRVVFDASAPTSSGMSINEIQMVGPTMQSDLFAILLRFRQHQCVVSADIANMYRQILVTPEQRHLQQILWRYNASDYLSTYQLNTDTYGTASAPFLAVRCFRQLGIENAKNFPSATAIILRDFYVDDLLTGSDCKETLSIHCYPVAEILKQGCFPLRKWISNEPSILEGIQVSNEGFSVLSLGPNENTKTLGLQWCCNSDYLSYSISLNIKEKTATKRSILSNISRIYDPLGLLSPCTIVIKIMLQKLWQEKIGWDESIPLELNSKWFHYKNELSSLASMKIPRHIKYHNFKYLELHRFSNASEVAYGACVYVRSTDEMGTIHVHLLCAKSKLVPIKAISIPRLEVCGALILSRLVIKYLHH